MRTTLTLDDDVAKKIEERCRKTGESMKSVVNETLRAGFSAERDMKPDEPFKVHARDLGLLPGLSYDNVADLLEQLEGADQR